jgi:hypothetical protein
MTEAQVEETIHAAEILGRELSHFQASIFLLAKEIVAGGPSEDFETAKAVVRDYSRYIANGTVVTSFAQFLLPIPFTDEEKAHSKKLRDEFLAYREANKNA